MKKLLISWTYLVIAVLIVVPLIQIVSGAWEEGWNGFAGALIRPEALHALGMTALIVVIVTILNTFFGVIAALYLVRGTWMSRRLRRLLNSLVDLPFAVSPVIGGLMIVLLFGPNTVLGAFFEGIGFKVVYALPGMVIATLFVTFPMMVREVMPVLQDAGTDQEEAAATLGAYSLYTFRHVTWPSIRWGVIYGVVLTVSRAMGEFGAVLIVSGNIMNKTQTATTLVYQDVENFNLAAANSVALVLAASSIVLLLIMERAKRRKEVHE
jgi:sulfate transport system permease protein